MNEVVLVQEDDLRVKYTSLRNYLDDPFGLDDHFEEYVTLSIKGGKGLDKASFELRRWLDAIDEYVSLTSCCDQYIYDYDWHELMEETHEELLGWYDFRKQSVSGCLYESHHIKLAVERLRGLRCFHMVSEFLRELDRNLVSFGITEGEFEPIHKIVEAHEIKMLRNGDGAEGRARLFIKKLQKVVHETFEVRRALQQVKTEREVCERNIYNTKRHHMLLKTRPNHMLGIIEQHPELTPVSANAINDSAQPVGAVEFEYNFVDKEKLLQKSLRCHLYQAVGINDIDGGREYKCPAGYIDIFGIDDDECLTVVELKKDKAGDSAIGQLLGYMQSIQDEYEDHEVRGILIAMDFTPRVIEAAKRADIELFSYETIVRVEKYQANVQKTVSGDTDNSGDLEE